MVHDIPDWTGRIIDSRYSSMIDQLLFSDVFSGTIVVPATNFQESDYFDLQPYSLYIPRQLIIDPPDSSAYQYSLVTSLGVFFLLSGAGQVIYDFPVGYPLFFSYGESCYVRIVNGLGSERSFKFYLLTERYDMPVGWTRRPVAAFSYSAAHTPPHVGDNISFSDASKFYPTSYAWDFGDGSTSDTINPHHVYAAPGDYVVSLTVVNDGGSDSYYAGVSVVNP